MLLLTINIWLYLHKQPFVKLLEFQITINGKYLTKVFKIRLVHILICIILLRVVTLSLYYVFHYTEAAVILTEQVSLDQ